MDPAQPSLTSPASWWQYGVLGVGILVFGIVIRYLFSEYRSVVKQSTEREIAMAAERAAWQTERERLATDYHAQVNQILKDYAQKIQEEHESCQEREDAIREDYAEMVEKMAAEQSKASDALINTLQKFQDRIVLSRRGGGY